jgi:sialidase-1
MAIPHTRGLGCLVLLGWASIGLALEQVDVFVSGQDGYHTYRIPAIEVAADGTLLALAEARKHNAADPGMNHNDIDLVMKRSTDRGQSWSPLVVLGRKPDTLLFWATCVS